MLLSKRYYILFALIGITTSCRKVIDLHLHDAASRWVVEGNITNQPGGCQVLLSQTADFDADNTFPPVSGANVTITDAAGNTTTLRETDPGTYEAPSLKATTGVPYRMQVIIQGDTISATSTMPVQVNFDSLYITEDVLFGNARLVANVSYLDPSDPGHYYQFVQTRNGEKIKQIYTADNELTAGRPQDIKLYIFNNDDDDKYKLKKEDIVQVEMQCLDEAAHAYWFSAEQSSTGQNQNAVPSNPISNLQGDALGYFSAHTSQVRTVTVP